VNIKKRKKRLLASGLTKREREIVDLIGKGLSNKEIAKELGICNQTVRNTLSKAFRKLGVHNRTALAVKLISSHVEFVSSHVASAV
jgi:two-component system, NarL family, response regulator DevR